MVVKISGLVLNYKGWFDLYTLPNQVNVILESGKKTPVQIQTSKLKWYIPSEILDEAGNVMMEYDEIDGEERPVIKNIPFHGTLEGVIEATYSLDIVTGKISFGDIKGLPEHCQLVSYQLDSTKTNINRRS